MVTILGIESTAHTFGIGIVKDGKVLANQRDMYTTESGGIIPTEGAKHHELVAEKVYLAALDEAKVSEDKINVIAFSQGPGLMPCLLAGMKFAKSLSKKLKKPLVGVNHCVAHLEITKCRSAYTLKGTSPKEPHPRVGAKDPVLLYVSGANTQVIAYQSGKYRVFGETLDLGVGNFIDTVARFMGEGFPGGPKIQKLAEKSSAPLGVYPKGHEPQSTEYRGKNYIELPYSVKGMDITLSGIQTKLRQMIESKKYSKEDLAYSLQETVFAMLVETAERALAHTGKKELALGGGVACNSRLQEMCKKMCDERIEKTEFFVPEKSLLVDNGAMIAYLGEIMFKSQQDDPKWPQNANVFSFEELDKVDVDSRERTDEVKVDWK